MYVILDKDRAISINVSKDLFPISIEAPDDTVFGDRYIDGEWVRCGERPETPTPAQRREQEYETTPLIEWEGEDIAVDQANAIFIQYLAEGNQKAEEIQALIATAKESIRQMYPDEVE